MALSGLRAVLPGLLLLALQTIPIAAIALERTALVVGNSAYGDAPLRNPVNDATDVAQVLEKQLGFEVILRTDVTQQQFDAAAREFRRRLQRRGGVGLFYYAGHGIQVDGHNYLIPVGANIDSETDVKYKAVDAGYVLGQMDEADASLNIVILDACRNNPYERSFRSASRGLVRLEMPAGELGSLLAYSTAPGKVAADGSGRNSPYTRHLLRALRLPDENIYRVFQKARIGVYKETNGQQIPWVSESLLGDFYFLRSQPDAIAKAPPKATPTPAKPLAQPASLTVRSNVYGDQVSIDGQRKGSTRLDVKLAPGWHTVRVEKDGYVPWEERVVLGAGERRTLRARLTDSPDTPAPTTQAGDSWREPMTDAAFAWIEGGCFQMGSPEDEAGRDDDERRHRVCGVEDLWLAKHEVTVSEFRRFVKASGYRTEEERADGCRAYVDGEWTWDEDRNWRSPGFEQNDRHPVVCVSWNDAQAYIGWLNRETQGGYRLPTEAEWEYAARAETQTARFWGKNPDDACRYANVGDEQYFSGDVHNCRDGYHYTAPVGRFKTNGFGLYDMLGNVYEWTCSVYDAEYGGAEKKCPNKDISARRVIRGGSWYTKPLTVRSAYRYWTTPVTRNYNIGFRLARTP